MKQYLISHLRTLRSKVAACNGPQYDLSIDVEEAERLLAQLEPILARIEVMNFRKRKV